MATTLIEQNNGYSRSDWFDKARILRCSDFRDINGMWASSQANAPADG